MRESHFPNQLKKFQIMNYSEAFESIMREEAGMKVKNRKKNIRT